MVFITQLIYIQSGQETVFNQFEAIAIPLISRHNGSLLLRVRPDKGAYIENSIEKPYEIHVVEFETDKDFDRFMQDDERKKFLHLKEQSIKAVVLIKGVKL
jgi:uncharacterized protein (DUF1330 family)